MTPIQETEIDMEKLEKRTMPSLTWRINEEKAEDVYKRQEDDGCTDYI